MLRPRAVKTINDYFNPFAIILIFSAAYLSAPGIKRVALSIGLVIFSALLNIITEYFALKTPKISRALINIRLIANFFINFMLVYMLINFWGPMWLLFVLTPVATAVYETRLKTVIATSLSCLALIIIYLHNGLYGVGFWGQGLNHVLFLGMLPFFIKSLAEKGELCDVETGA
jgi:hypothetical protein